MRRLGALTMLLLFNSLAFAQDAPPLPTGLGGDSGPSTSDEAPALPSGLGEAEETPSLPAGLEGPAEAPEEETPSEKPKLDLPFTLSGFWEVRGGVRTQNDVHEKDASIGETRLQLEIDKRWENASVRVVGDFLYDPVMDRHSVNLERGQGWFDLREANVLFTPVSFMDVKIGRQILTWGTGDLLFLNDLFPKDWQSFFIGRDVEYLKAPSDAIKLGFFSDLGTLNVVFVPRFDSDRFITGRRLSYFNNLLNDRAGRNAPVHADIPNRWFRDHEWHVRWAKNVRGYEFALYGYWGYWKSPGGMELLSQRATFPRLSVYGGSVRGQVGKGIGNAEVAYYDSRQDRNGDDPFVNNSQMRFLVGYERDLPEITSDLTVGVQYYAEWMMNYDEYTGSFFAASKDRVRQVLTFRVTKLLMNQNLTLGMFAYYSPTDTDAYLRPNINYKIDDHWTAEVGGNVFFGNNRYSFFSQFQDNSNVYLALRYSF